MPRFIDPTGESTYGLGICARCSRKFRLAELNPDPNYPALMVCDEDTDDYDPYRLAAKPEDQVVLPFVRPDSPLTTRPSGLITQDGTQFIVSEDGQRFLFVID
ncbi:hypothetical protein UFOVP126_9 [uncultured Caudovirales phage]|uniref:Uncharacterized protein n=1 Tax=uncultured Caudovirales phage TaxID=2100421 RepID=A0A6J5KKD8_9CAUD|nr:hypothetical protein UFOVP37_44 [uncultured Caudovirales phage]CAB4130688.1 hypothetical protein UFOVP126_9 [uncultured Caudovirales phage]